MQKMIEAGYKVVGFEEQADVYIINTCTVTNMADKKSRQMIRRVKEINKNAILVAVGCYAQVASKELEEIEEIDLILGVDEKKDIVKYIEKKIQEIKDSKISTRTIIDKEKSHEFVDFGTITHTEKTRAVIKVQDGCNQFCSYCIIPYARGRIRSRKPESVLKEISRIGKDGIKEVVITGIHVASYGVDFETEYRLIDLLEEIQNIPEIKRIRLGSLEPTLITKEFVQRLKKLTKICDQFHLSLQSGCNETLKRMNRKYTVEQFEKATKLLREAFSNVHLTTDIIVGFPGETKEEFEQTYEFLKKIKFYKMHVFKYSPRKGTVATNMPNQIDGNIKEERSKMLIELSNKLQEEYNEQYINKQVEVLLESVEEGYLNGHTTNYMNIKIEIEDEIEQYVNTIQKVKIIEKNGIELLGKIEK